MKAIVILALAALAQAKPDDKYDSKYDNFDVDGVINNPRLMKAYILCFLGEGKCTPDGLNFKSWIPESLQTGCGKCSEKQKVISAKVIKAVREKMPQEWARLSKKHDPEHKYSAQLEAFVSKYSS